MKTVLIYHFLSIIVGLDILRLFFKKKEEPYTYMIWGLIIGAVVQIGVKYVVPLFRRRTYTSGAYALGEIYRRNVLGENISTRDDRVVGDSATYLARNLFTAGFGVLCSSNDHYEMIYNNDYAQYSTRFAKELPTYKFTKAQFDRAATLAKMYFVNRPAPVQVVWDLNNFAKLPYLGPIPDPENPGKLMTCELPGGVYVKDGYFANLTNADQNLIKQADGTLTQAPGQTGSAIPTGAPAATGNSNNLMLLGAAGVGAYLLFKK